MILSVFITVISGHDKPQPPGCLLERYGIENVSLLPGHESGLYEKLHDDRRNNN